MPDRLGLYFQDNYSLQDSIKLVQYAESRGFEAVWQAESRLARDAIVAMAAYAAHTSRIRIGSAVVNAWSRNVASLAAAFLTLDDLAPDRILCGLGPWPDPLAARSGVRREKPLLAMREVVQALRGLLAMQRVTHFGEYVQLDGVELDVIYGRREPRQIPLYMGVTGPRMMALAGEIADGVILNTLVSPRYNEGAIARLEQGAHQAGRFWQQIDRPQLIVCSVDRSRDLALDRARRLITPALVQQPDAMKASGVKQELLDEVAQVLAYPFPEPQIREAMRLVPDDVVQLVTASGDAGEVKAKIRAYAASGVTCPVLYVLGDMRYTIDVFADGFSR